MSALGNGEMTTSETKMRIREERRKGERISRNINTLHREQMTIGEKLADQLAEMAGSWRFIISFLVVVCLWIILNAFLLITGPWDPYPFILLNLILSLMAGLQAPIIMMSQNRQETKDRIRAEHDYDVNLKAEIEIEQLHVKLDLLRETQWQELVEMQHRQIALLEQQLETLNKMWNPPNNAMTR